MSHDPGLVKSGSLDNIRRLGGDDLLQKMIRLFLENAPKRLEVLRKAVDAGEAKAAADAAHSLRSSAGNLGAEGLMLAAQRLEQAAKEARPEALAPLADELEALFERVRARLEHELGR